MSAHVLTQEETGASDEVALELALWDSVKDGGPDELAAYLERYPEGTFASLARTRQAVPNEAGHAEERAELDAAFWDAIKDTQTDDELAAYLEQHPHGHFAPWRGHASATVNLSHLASKHRARPVNRRSNWHFGKV